MVCGAFAHEWWLKKRTENSGRAEAGQEILAGRRCGIGDLLSMLKSECIVHGACLRTVFSYAHALDGILA